MSRSRLFGTTGLLSMLASGIAAPSLLSPSFAAMNTTFTNDLSADGFSWAQAGASGPILIDSYGKIIIPTQRQNSGTKQNNFVYSNNGGTTWADAGLTEGFLERGTAALDATNSVLHVLWTAAAATDGIIYRRYTISRDGSNNITGITKDTGVNLQLDFQALGTMQYQHPIMVHLNDGGDDGTYGKLLAIWSARNTGVGGTGNEIRASMCVLGATADAGKLVINWTFPVTNDSTTIGNAPAVAYTQLLANATTGIPHASALRKVSGTNANDVYLCYHDGGATASALWRFRRLRWNSGANKWSTGLTSPTTITATQRTGSDTGYNLKQQLGSKLAHDTANDRVYFGFPTWKSNTDGDTWGYAYIDSADAVSSLVDVYSVGGAHSYAPTGDIIYDATAARLVVSYIKTTSQDAYVRLYSGTSAAAAEVLAYSAADVDIPLMYAGRVSGKVLMAFRVAGSPPQAGVAGTLTWN